MLNRMVLAGRKGVASVAMEQEQELSNLSYCLAFNILSEQNVRIIRCKMRVVGCLVAQVLSTALFAASLVSCLSSSMPLTSSILSFQN